MPDERDDDDKSIVNALSALGWVEEKEEKEDLEESTESDLNVQEQINLYKKKIELLNEEVKQISTEKDELIKLSHLKMAEPIFVFTYENKKRKGKCTFLNLKNGELFTESSLN